MEPEARTVQKVQAERVPAGVFQNCYAIYDIYTSGPLIQRLCQGVGIVREDYDHSGTPFGSHSQLVEYRAGK